MAVSGTVEVRQSLQQALGAVPGHNDVRCHDVRMMSDVTMNVRMMSDYLVTVLRVTRLWPPVISTLSPADMAQA